MERPGGRSGGNRLYHFAARATGTEILAQMLQPLAIGVIGGIVASMVLSLVVTPAVHCYRSLKAGMTNGVQGVA